MGATLKFANLWRVIREIDLHAIRAAALSPVELWLVDDGVDAVGLVGTDPRAELKEAAQAGTDLARAEPGDAGSRRSDRRPAERMRALLTGDALVPHPSLRLVRAAEVASLAGAVLPAAAIVIAPAPAVSLSIESALTALRRGRVPIVVVSPGHDRPDDRLTLATERHVGVAALDAAAMARIATALVSVVPADLRLALARQFPPLRPAVFDATIDETAKANASYALTTGFAEVVPVLTVPLNLGDMIVLTKNQLVMSYRLALAAGRDGEPRAMIGEILGVLGGGLLFRQLARQLVGLIPVAGLVPKVAIAYGGTWAIGRAIVLWATEGREVTSDLVRTLSAEGMQRGRSVATRLVEQARAQRGRAGQRWARLKDQLPLIGRRGRS